MSDLRFDREYPDLYAKLDLLSKAEIFSRIQDTAAQFGSSPLPDDFIDMNDKSSLIDLAINLEWTLDRKDKNH